MAKTLVKADCQKCGNPFEYNAARRPQGGGIAQRWVCDDCKEKTIVAAHARQIKERSAMRKGDKETKFAGGDKGKSAAASGVVRMTQQEAADVMGISKGHFEILERQVLLKIRNNPELMKLWNRFKDEGFPLPEKLFPNTDAGRKLLDYQLQVIEWWQAHDAIEDKACRAAYQKELAVFQGKIAKTLKKILDNGN